MPAPGLRAIADRRLATQGISDPRFASPQAVVAWHGAVQSQEYAYAKWTLGQRMRSASVADVDAAIESGAIVRTHVLRPTWHFVVAEDLRWMQALTAPRVRRFNATYDARLGLDEDAYRRSSAAIADALRGGEHLTRQQLKVAIADAGIPVDGVQQLAHLVMRAELDALICNGVPRGKQHTYALVDERVPPTMPLTVPEAMTELVRRYFTSHGPATLKDFAWWSSLPAKAVAPYLDAPEAGLKHVEVNGQTFWAAPHASGRDRDASPTAHLLQAYDEYIIGYTESRSALDVDGLFGAAPRGAQFFYHCLVVDGQFAGHWRQETRGRSSAIEVQLRRRHSAIEGRALEDAVQRYATFSGSR